MAGFTVAHLEALEAAIASGELTVQYDGKSVTYRNMKDLLMARDRVKAELLTGALGHLDRSLGRADDAVAMW